MKDFTENININRKDNEGNFILLPLPYTDDHLEPYVSERTVRNHYWAHLRTYLDNLNSLKGAYSTDDTIRDILRDNQTKQNFLYKNASQVFNHYLYFNQLNPNGEKAPLSKTSALIEKTCINFERFKDEITTIGSAVFGSGWVFIVYDGNKLFVATYNGTGTPLRGVPILALDVWEHAYYLDYQSKRRDYIDNFFNLVDWRVIEKRIEDYEKNSNT